MGPAEELKSRDENSNLNPDGLNPKFVNIAEAWTRERLHDAHAFRRLSKSVSDVSLYKYHKNVWALLKALPIAVPHYMGRMKFTGKSARSPCFLFAVHPCTLAVEHSLLHFADFFCYEFCS